MTLFVVSLFLPHTVNFDPPTSEPSSPDDITPQTPSALTSYNDARPLLLLEPSSASLVQTPGATTDHEHIFMPQVSKPFNLTMPSVFTEDEVIDIRPTTPRARDPRKIARADTHSPAWGKTGTWSQPKSRAKSPPPSSILKYNQTKERSGSMLFRAQNKYRNRTRSRTLSHERRYSIDHNYCIDQAQIGNGGLFNAIAAATDAGLLLDKTWVGTIGMPTDDLDDHLKERISERLEDDYESLAVYVGDSDFNSHYEHYCKTILWPVFHYQIPDHPKSKAYQDHSWEFYKKVNQVFADRIATNYKKGDVIWIHDYHLLLLPKMLREKLPDAEVGFFLHTAFPSSEIFRCLPTRAELLEGILGANMIGFQTEEYGHHFLQTCSRLLNVEALKTGLVLESGRFVHVGYFPIGIDPVGLESRRALPEVSEWISIISEKYKDKRILVARDKLDNIRGVRHKMIAYEKFLRQNPEYRDQVVLIQIATSTTEEPELSGEITDIVMRINSMYSTLAHQPVVFLRQDIDYSQYFALLTVAECLLVTSVREGMNLTSHEYIFCQDGKYSDNKWNPLILSEFTGSASLLDHKPLLVNPWDTTQCAKAIKKALDMPLEERKSRWEWLFETIISQSAIRWFDTYTKALKHAWEEHSIRDSSSVPRLSIPQLKYKYEKANKRLFILDYEGTLATCGGSDDIFMNLPKRVGDILNDLLDDKRNTVYVMSSRTPDELENLFQKVPGLGLIAENGAFLLEAGTEEWIALTDLDHVEEWKKGVKSIFEYYNTRIGGSRIDERHSAMIFDYSDAEDLPNAFKQAGECANHINDACQKQNVHAIPVDKKIFVSDIELNKSTATSAISNNMLMQRKDSEQPLSDFLLVVGDSREDEYVFSWADKLEKSGLITDVCTVTLGARSTGASHTLTPGVTGVLSTLKKLTAQN